MIQQADPADAAEPARADRLCLRLPGPDLPALLLDRADPLRLLRELSRVGHARAGGGHALPGAGELPVSADRGPSLLPGPAQHRCIYGRGRGDLGGAGPRAGPPAQPPRPPARLLARDLLPPDRYLLDRRLPDLVLPVQHELRPLRRPAGARRPPPAPLPRQPIRGTAERDRRRDLAVRRLLYGSLSGRVAGHPAGVLRCGERGRRDDLAGLPPRHAAPAAADDSVRPGCQHDRRAPGLRHHLRDDRRRPGERDLYRRRLHLRYSLQVPAHGAGDRDVLPALRDHPGDHAGPAPPAARRVRGVRRRLAVGEVAITAALYLITAVGAVIMLLPFYWMVASSLMTLPEIIARPPVWFPRVPQLHNYADLAAALPIDRIYINSLIVTISVTSLVLFTSSLTGFGFAKYHFPGRDTLFLLVLATMMIPFFLLLIPVFFIVKELGWVDTYLGLIVPNAVTAYGIFLMRQFILGVPDELLDAARIDGSSEFGLYWRIVLPLSGPALAALTILAFLYHWNAFLSPLVVIRSQDLWTIPIGLNNLRLYASSTDTLDLQMAGATIAVVPVLVVFVALQRYFIQGITLSGLKG